MTQFLGCYVTTFGRLNYVLLNGDWDNALGWQQMMEYEWGKASWIRLLPN